MPIMRDTLLWLSRSRRLRESVITLPPARKMSRKFIAGEMLGEALSVIESLNKAGILGILDFLGENTTNAAEAEAYTNEQVAEVLGIAERGLKSYVSLKLTAMGLDIDVDVAKANLRRVLETAAARNVFVRIDMESSDYVDPTLGIYHAMRDEGFDGVGVVIQSCLRRSLDDVRGLLQRGANIRLVKGAYNEPADRAFPDKADVDRNLVELIKLMLGPEAVARGAFCAVATHDESVIRFTKAWTLDHGVPRDRYEFQMLYGIKTGMHRQLASEGYAFRAYIPYGTHWYPYFMRRLAERPANVWFVLKGALG